MNSFAQKKGIPEEEWCQLIYWRSIPFYYVGGFNRGTRLETKTYYFQTSLKDITNEEF